MCCWRAPLPRRAGRLRFWGIYDCWSARAWYTPIGTATHRGRFTRILTGIHMSDSLHSIFIRGGTGYIGSRLIPRLRAHGHAVTALVREQSRHKLPEGCDAVIGNALDGGSY